MAVNETPLFWYEKPGLKAWLLWPFAAIYGRVAAINMLAKPTAQVGVPVLCIGNFVAGGGGKTPTAIALAGSVLSRGFNLGFLSRGYGGRVSTATLVDTGKHNASDVGDEPLLLAEIAPTVVSADRIGGAKQLIEHGCNFIIMDDGFQNPKLLKDYCLIVVDARRGIGNGFVMPAGPLRARLKDQIGKADSILAIGTGNGADSIIRDTARSARPVYTGNLVVRNKPQWKGKWILPFAGIADPEKFYTSLREVGADIAQISSFGDHHYFTDDEAKEFLDRAKLMKAQLVTTAKDHVRLKGRSGAREKLAENSIVVHVRLYFEDEYIPNLIIDKTLERFDARMLGASTR